jgi:hypothetical protein
VEVLKQGCWWPSHVMDVSWEAAATGPAAGAVVGPSAGGGPAAAAGGREGLALTDVGGGPSSSSCLARTVQCVLVRNAAPPEADGTVWRAPATAVR